MFTHTAALMLLAGSALAQPFTPINVGTFGPAPGSPPYNASSASDINNAHTVVGSSSHPAVTGGRGFSWTQSGGLVALPNIASPFSVLYSANAINASGQIAGNITVSGGVRAALVSGGVTTNLGTLSPLLSSRANGINNQGEVVGTCYDPNGSLPSFGFIHRNGVMQLAGTLAEAHDINAAGYIVGHGGSTWQARMWDSVGGTTVNLGTLGGISSRAYAINSFNQVVGWASTGTGAWDAYVWTQVSGMINLNVGAQLAGGDSFAADINDVGEIVGSYRSGPTGALRAFYSVGGVATDLNTLLPSNSGWILEGASAINDHGCIVGGGLYNGEPRGFVLCIPAPSAAAALGLTALVASRRKR